MKWIRILFRLIFTFLGLGIGLVTLNLLKAFGVDLTHWFGTSAKMVGGGILFLFAIIFFILSPQAYNGLEKILSKVEEGSKDHPVSEIFFGALGIIIGLILAYLLSIPVYAMGVPVLSTAISFLLYLVLGILGLRMGTRGREELQLKWKENEKSSDWPLAQFFSKKDDREKAARIGGKGIPKILDTSVLIDGRVDDIVRVGFLEGPLVVSTHVLEELQHIADSPDGLKRNRGRRGLDVLQAMQDRKTPEIIISTEPYKDIEEVDAKLLQLTKDLQGKVVTNDFNLNKVATLQGLEVLNINALANAVKPAVLQGEKMIVKIIREGKEPEQGLGYLDDGTMIVVDHGKNRIGETVPVTVNTVLQTTAGKMIFARINEEMD